MLPAWSHSPFSRSTSGVSVTACASTSGRRFETPRHFHAALADRRPFSNAPPDQARLVPGGLARLAASLEVPSPAAFADRVAFRREMPTSRNLSRSDVAAVVSSSIARPSLRFFAIEPTKCRRVRAGIAECLSFAPACFLWLRGAASLSETAAGAMRRRNLASETRLLRR